MIHVFDCFIEKILKLDIEYRIKSIWKIEYWFETLFFLFLFQLNYKTINSEIIFSTIISSQKTKYFFRHRILRLISILLKGFFSCFVRNKAFNRSLLSNKWLRIFKQSKRMVIIWLYIKSLSIVSKFIGLGLKWVFVSQFVLRIRNVVSNTLILCDKSYE